MRTSKAKDFVQLRGSTLVLFLDKTPKKNDFIIQFRWITSLTWVVNFSLVLIIPLLFGTRLNTNSTTKQAVPSPNSSVRTQKNNFRQIKIVVLDKKKSKKQNLKAQHDKDKIFTAIRKRKKKKIKTLDNESIEIKRAYTVLGCWISASRAFRESLNDTLAMERQFPARRRRGRLRSEAKESLMLFPFLEEKIFPPQFDDRYFRRWEKEDGFFGKFVILDNPLLCFRFRFSKTLYQEKTRSGFGYCLFCPRSAMIVRDKKI